jgi:hypothetical protein
MSTELETKDQTDPPECKDVSVNADGSNNNQIRAVLNRDQQYLSEHGHKLFNAINCLLDNEEQLELTQALFKYQTEQNVFTLVRTCRELFDTTRKKSLMLFMRPVIPIRDRFHYDEYYKLFFPEEFTTKVTSIFTDLIPKDLLDKTMHKANEKKKANQEKEKEKEQLEHIEAIKLLEKVNYELSTDIQKLMSKTNTTNGTSNDQGKINESPILKQQCNNNNNNNNQRINEDYISKFSSSKPILKTDTTFNYTINKNDNKSNSSQKIKHNKLSLLLCSSYCFKIVSCLKKGKKLLGSRNKQKASSNKDHY